MSLKRIAKTCGALVGGQGVNVIGQLLVPPIFLRHYSIASYGEWLTLSATVSYISTLNFGLQTFANNQVAICYNRGEVEEARTLQATAFAILLCIIGAAALLTASVFILPVSHWLALKTSPQIVSLTIYLLGLQVLIKMIFGFLGGTFLAIGISHRGSNWNNVQTLVSVLGTATVAFFHVSFAWIAAQQIITLTVFCLLIMLDLRAKAPEIFPRLRFTDFSRAGYILKPSGYFGMLYSSNFLVYQMPVILMQRMLGPTTVVVFSLSRTIYSMSRQGLTSLTNAIGPEVTEFYGLQNWKRLFRLYELSERVILALVPIVTFGTLLATPVLLSLWLHKPSLYNASISVMMGLISGLMGIKDHKYQFQSSSNEHALVAPSIFWSYVVMVIIAIPGLHFFGIMGFLVLWLATEFFQTSVILRSNYRLFSDFAALDFSPVYKLFGLMLAAAFPAVWLAYTAPRRPLLQDSLITLVFIGVLAAIAYPLFGLEEVRGNLQSRFRSLQAKV